MFPRYSNTCLHPRSLTKNIRSTSQIVNLTSVSAACTEALIELLVASCARMLLLRSVLMARLFKSYYESCWRIMPPYPANLSASPYETCHPMYRSSESHYSPHLLFHAAQQPSKLWIEDTILVASVHCTPLPVSTSARPALMDGRKILNRFHS